MQEAAGPKNIAANAKVGGKDQEMREAFRGLSERKQTAILQLGGIPRADWDAKAKIIDPKFWSFVRAKGAPSASNNSGL